MLLGIMGRKQAGKSTVAGILVRTHGFTEMSFAQPLKDAYYALDPVVWAEDGEMIHAQEIIDKYGWDYAKENHPEVRRGLQRMGTEMGRDVFGEGFWVNLMEAKLEAALGWDHEWPGHEDKANIVIPDVRFPNEIALVQKWGGVLWRVDRDRLPPEDPFDPLMTHESEVAWRSTWPDVVICNDATLGGLAVVMPKVLDKTMGVIRDRRHPSPAAWTPVPVPHPY